MIRLAGAGVRYGRRWIFRRLDLGLERGACLAVLGPNGRGKTTLIRAALGLVPLGEGTREAPEIIGYVPQASAAAVPYRVLDVVVMSRARRLGVFGRPGRADYAAAAEALERVGAAEFAERAFDRLSGGERQIVLLARALATGAAALVLDEPASALDLANQDRFLSVLADLHRDGRHAILFSTHMPQHALHVADEALLMIDVEEHRRGPVDAILSETDLARLYGLPVRRVRVEGTDIETVVPLFGQGRRAA